jgi:hypothetical protein
MIAGQFDNAMIRLTAVTRGDDVVKVAAAAAPGISVAA